MRYDIVLELARTVEALITTNITMDERMQDLKAVGFDII
jgi:hypothetical protein